MPGKILDSDSSQKENSNGGGINQANSVKTKVKIELRDANRRKGVAPRGKRRGSTLAASEDIENEEEHDETTDSDSPNGRKRARINEGGEGRPSPLRQEKLRAPRRDTLPHDKDGYVPGSIVRVQLENFVTYDWVEFRPGPNLNMILGPNGTGKSSIACALCIGLNGAPTILGRSAELNAFVKHGHDHGYIEIELKGRIGTPNLVIRRKINSKNRSSQFTLNGQVVPAREISERIAELNIQVGNLCSFLPQDRVSEFAQMTPQQLLEETQRTAGDENLTLWHNTLIEKGKELTAQQNLLKEDKKQIVQLEEKQKALEKDVKRYHERRQIERQIELLEVVLPYVAYKESKNKYDEAKSARERAAADFKRLEEANRPLKDLQTELNEQYEKLGIEREKLKKEVSGGYQKSMSSMEARNKKANEQADEALETLKSLKRKEKDRIKGIAKAKEDIVRWQEKVDNPPEYEDVEALNEQMKPIKAQGVELNVSRERIKGQAEAFIRETAEQDQTILQCQHELQKLDSFKDQKLNNLRGWDADCADVVVWLERNKETKPFAQRVTLPAYVSLEVRDQRYVNAIEACFNAHQIKTFVTHSEEDFRTFNRLFIDTPEALGRKVRVTVWYRPQDEAQLLRPPLDPNELKNIGFDGYAIDYIKCPDGLGWFLTKELNMHRTPIALDPRSVDENSAQEALSRSSHDGRAPPNCAYIAGETYGMVSCSAYGQCKSMTTTRSIRRAQSLVVPTADLVAKRELEQRVTQAQARNMELGEQISQLRKEDQGLAEKLDERKRAFNELSKRRDIVNSIRKQIMTNESKLASLKSHLHELECRPSADAERPKHQAIVQKTVKERTKILNEFLTLTQSVIKKQATLSAMLLQQMKLKASVAAIDILCSERTTEAKRVKQAFNEACGHFDEVKKDSTAKVGVLRAKLEEVDEELQQNFRAMEEEDAKKHPDDQWTSEKVEVLLETERAKLELNHATDSGVIRTYENRVREIETLKHSADQKGGKVKKLEDKMKTTKDLWYPAITDLVTAVGEKFSAAFDRIGCAGEIRIADAEDYEKWAIQIYVKFRNEEPLTLLTGQRQSGGERSLTTIMYLMSLTEHARAPFSLVDEINQGMDQQYERSVHNQLVKVTCNADSGQYFLITPKLLPGLQYHKNMKILCVNNGEWLPDSRGLGNMGKMIDDVEAKCRTRPAAS